jgi:uncharacterized BrkB/YihY/UPF0761 family membrane protein
MTLETLRLIRNVLLRSFAIGVVIALLMAIGFVVARPIWTGLVISWFHTDEAGLSTLVLRLFTEIRFYLVFVLLVPGLAIHWTIRSELARSK